MPSWDRIAANTAQYETVAASQAAQVLGGSGAIGDFIERVVVVPTSTTAGAISLIDNATSIQIYAGGTLGADLKPFEIPLGMKSVSGAWKLTTGAGVTAIAVGKFS
jgi:hypothetical protein